MPLMVVVTAKFSPEFDNAFLRYVIQLGAEANLDHTVSEGDVKVYYVSLVDKLLEINVISLLKEFFRFDQDILGITFLRKWESTYEQGPKFDRDSVDRPEEKSGDDVGASTE